MRFIPIMALVLVINLTACATHNVPKKYALKESGQSGIIIGSITRTKSSKGHQGFSAIAWGVTLFGRGIDNKEHFQIIIGDAVLAGLYRSDFREAYGELFVIELKPGKYEIYSWSAQPDAYTRVGPKKEFSILFNMAKGNAIYIGELNLEVISRKNIFGIGIIAGAELKIKDNYERDIDVLKSKYPNIDVSKIEKAILEKGVSITDEVERDTTIIIP